MAAFTFRLQFIYQLTFARLCCIIIYLKISVTKTFVSNSCYSIVMSQLSFPWAQLVSAGLCWAQLASSGFLLISRAFSFWNTMSWMPIMSCSSHRKVLEKGGFFQAIQLFLYFYSDITDLTNKSYNMGKLKINGQKNMATLWREQIIMNKKYNIIQNHRIKILGKNKGFEIM